MTRSCLAALGVAVITISNADAQQISLFADINQHPAVFNSYPRVAGSDGVLAMYLVPDPFTGAEPWISDGTVAGTHLIADMQPGYAGTMGAALLGRVGSRLIFGAGPDQKTMSVWAADPPYTSPIHISDVRVAPLSFRSSGVRSIPNSASLGDVVVFAARTPAHGVELWATAGTPESTRMIANIAEEETNSFPTDFLVADGVAYFVGADGGAELWRTDGTPEGTFIVYNSGQARGLRPSELVDTGDSIFFFASSTFSSAQELWRTDGTSKGTVRVHSLAPNAIARSLAGNSSTLFFYATINANAGLFSFDIETATLTFLAPRSSLWVVEPVPPAITPTGAFFSRATAEHGRELWFTDGTLEGTVLVHDINPGSASGVLSEPVVARSRVIFLADDGKSGPSLWSSDGTPKGALRLVSSQNWFGPDPRMIAGGRPIFELNDGVHGYTLWTSDGTIEGTTMLVAPPDASGNAGSYPSLFTYADKAHESVVFAADDGEHGFEPWSLASDGAASILGDIRPGASSSLGGGFVHSAGQAFFQATTAAHGAELWRTDGTPQGTRIVRDISPGPDGSITTRIAPVSTGVVFGANTPDSGNDLWFSDGIEANTRLLQNFPAALTSFQLHSAGGRAYYAPISGASSNSLRSTDGVSTRAEASMSGWIMAQTSNNVANIGGNLLFVAVSTQANTGEELWIKPASGSAAALPEIEPGPASPEVSLFVQSDSLAFFTAFSSNTGYELWRSDATPGGTHLALDIIPGAGSSSPEQLTIAGSVLFFTARTPEHGRELWVSDGSAAGTRLVADITPGPGSSTPLSITPTGPGRVIFSAFSPGRGAELWESDGTPEGTRLVADILPGEASSGPSDFFVRDDGSVLFSAADPEHGREPWIYDPTACACDWNRSDSLNSADFFDFLIDFFDNDADFNASGRTDSNDFFDFLACFFAGCQ